MDKVKNGKNKVYTSATPDVTLGVVVAQGMLFSGGILLNKIMLRMRFIVLWVDTRGSGYLLYTYVYAVLKGQLQRRAVVYLFKTEKVKIEWSQGHPINRQQNE